jgi:cytochrome c oxidase accessory protein FixG
MCPYARFQGVMFDPDTLIITYDRERGEPRGARNRSVDYKAKGLGDCVDCGICVQVCPTGIDIRNGLQYECIGCAACIDGCDQVMSKMGYPKGLIRYSTETAVKQHLDSKAIAKRVFRGRTLVYTSILMVVAVAGSVTLYNRVPVKVDVIRDRASFVRDASDPVVQNVYRLQIMNTQERRAAFAISVSGIEGIHLLGDSTSQIELGPASQKVVAVRVEASRASAKPGSNRIQFTVDATDPAGAGQPIRIVEKTTFVVQ